MTDMTIQQKRRRLYYLRERAKELAAELKAVREERDALAADIQTEVAQ